MWSRQQRQRLGTRTSSSFRKRYQEDGDGGGDLRKQAVKVRREFDARVCTSTREDCAETRREKALEEPVMTEGSGWRR